MDVRAELSQFLKSRRARLRPEDVGLVRYGERRRVPGLRREELAQLAGISITHYTRLEQGQRQHVSAQTLDAIADALRLTGDERAHLHHLVRPVRPGGAAGPPAVREGVRDLLDSLEIVPAVVTGHRTELLAWNPLISALVGGIEKLPPERRTMSHWVFFDEDARRVLGDTWEEHARNNVAFLRTAAVRRPGDERLRGHLAVMRVQSREFEDLWQEHEVREWSSGEMRIHHPLVGPLELRIERLHFPADPDVSGIDMWPARSGSPSQAALRRLAATLRRPAS
ncbi:helix-turn-helix domain-containing protein [Actinomadura kijaniata]|uniref:helix-turn-helix domain-containing protein n=1 Tax=Actinomadura kijaniata TaxID=46161 RepID=UPI00082968EC|nr:helix-turn-helix transcriptional regulator [Actinomadura kijaniata]